MLETIVTIYNPFLDPLMVTATYCPTCGKPAKTYEEAEEIRGLGECLRCDHVRGEVTDDLHDEAKAFEDEMNEELYGSGEVSYHTVENWDGETSEDKWITDAYIEDGDDTAWDAFKESEDR